MNLSRLRLPRSISSTINAVDAAAPLLLDPQVVSKVVDATVPTLFKVAAPVAGLDDLAAYDTFATQSAFLGAVAATGWSIVVGFSQNVNSFWLLMSQSLWPFSLFVLVALLAGLQKGLAAYYTQGARQAFLEYTNRGRPIVFFAFGLGCILLCAAVPATCVAYLSDSPKSFFLFTTVPPTIAAGAAFVMVISTGWSAVRAWLMKGGPVLKPMGSKKDVKVNDILALVVGLFALAYLIGLPIEYWAHHDDA